MLQQVLLVGDEDTGERSVAAALDRRRCRGPFDEDGG